MLITRVQYTVKDEFAANNEENIKAVMQAARGLSNPGIKYSAFRLEGADFLHLAVFENEDAQGALTGLPEFGNFQAELKQNLVKPPQVVKAQMVGSTFDWF